MTDPPDQVVTETDAQKGREVEEAGTPRWVKVFGIVAVAVVLVFVILLLTGGGSHGPGRHMGGGDTPSSTTELTAPSDAP